MSGHCGCIGSRIVVLVGLLAFMALAQIGSLAEESYQASTIQLQENSSIGSADQGSIFGRQTWIANTRTGTIMKLGVSQARSMEGGLQLYAEDSSYTDYNGVNRSSSTIQMRVDEQVEQARVNLGVLQGSRGSAPWKDPRMEIDEDYWGTFHISKEMTLAEDYGQVRHVPDWLECCPGVVEDWDDESLWPRGIFECVLPGGWEGRLD